jgi:hydroxypyruvate isomerase
MSIVRRSVSIQLMWDDRGYPERAAAAADAGFDLVDLWDWRSSDIDGVAEVCRDRGTGINAFFGNRDHALCDPQDRQAALDEISRSLECAERVGARQLSLFCNAIRPGGVVVPAPPLPAELLHATLVDGVRSAAELAHGSGVTLALEHLNPVFLPAYLWSDIADTAVVAREVDAAEVGVAFDAFHQQLAGGRLTEHLLAVLPWLIRFDVAEVPGRHEPGVGEVDFTHLRRVLLREGWDGTVAFEVVPSDGDPATAVRAIEAVWPRQETEAAPVATGQEA